MEVLCGGLVAFGRPRHSARLRFASIRGAGYALSYEAPAHRFDLDACHRPAGLDGRICGDFTGVDRLSDHGSLWCIGGFVLSQPTRSELLPRSLPLDRRRHGLADGAHLVYSAIGVDGG